PGRGHSHAHAGHRRVRVRRHRGAGRRRARAPRLGGLSMTEPTAPAWPTVTAEQVRSRVKAKTVTEAVELALEGAVGMVELALLDAYRPVLDTDYVECVLRVAYALYDGTKSSDGVRQQV